MSDQACVSCGRPLRPEARFCQSCGPPAVLAAPAPVQRSVKRDAGWHSLLNTVFLYASLLGVSLALGLTRWITKSDWTEIGAEIAQAVIVAAFTVRCFNDVSSGLRWRRIRPQDTLKILAATVAVAGFLIFYFGALEMLGVPFDKSIEHFVQSPWNKWIAFGATVIAPPLIEETAFRGIIQTRLEAVLTPVESNIVQAACFAVLHLSPLIFVSHFMMGLYLGYLKRRTGSLYLGMIAHGAWNAFVLSQQT